MLFKSFRGKSEFYQLTEFPRNDLNNIYILLDSSKEKKIIQIRKFYQELDVFTRNSEVFTQNSKVFTQKSDVFTRNSDVAEFRYFHSEFRYLTQNSDVFTRNSNVFTRNELFLLNYKVYSF